MGFFGVGDRAALARVANRLVNAPVTPAFLLSACERLGEELDVQEDQQASAAMRRHLARVLLARCVAALLQRPELNANGGVV
jgi:carbon-monoxide dehydrogenase medium subunit